MTSQVYFRIQFDGMLSKGIKVFLVFSSLRSVLENEDRLKSTLGEEKAELNHAIKFIQKTSKHYSSNRVDG